MAARKKTAGYSGTPLVKKLGIKPGFVVALLDAPEDFEATLGPVPDDAALKTSARGKHDLAIVFCRDQRTLNHRLQQLAQRLGQAGMWIAWPKKTSGVETDLTGDVVRNSGLATGLVDFKVCAIDQTWSGLKFQRRKKG